jgi:hypothetical protein
METRINAPKVLIVDDEIRPQESLRMILKLTAMSSRSRMGMPPFKWSADGPGCRHAGSQDARDIRD